MSYKEVGVKNVYSPPPSKCDGVGSTGTIPDKYKNIYPAYRVVCFGCGEEFKPIRSSGGVPNHPPKSFRSFFPAKYADTCCVVRHPIHKGDQVRYFGTKIVCKAHA